MLADTKINRDEKKPEFISKHCVGCGICESVCPKKAIEIRRNGVEFVAEISDSCVFCGICADLCLYGALKQEISVYSDLLEEIGFEKFKVDEEVCILCGLCMRECPRGAIKVVRQFDKNKLRRGTIKIKDGCIDCRMCVEICPTKAISVYRNKPTIDAMKCIFCEMCARICPMNVLEIRCDSCRNISDRTQALSGKVVVDIGICSLCGICEEICPKKAIKVTKFFSGEQKWFKEKCIVDCTVCRDICPNFAVNYSYEPEKVVKFNGRCNFCGTCERFCPGNAIEIERKLPFDIRLSFRNVRKDNRIKLIKLEGTCIGCGICTSICPVGRREVIEIVNGVVMEKNTSECTACGLCVANCPVESLRIFEIS